MKKVRILDLAILAVFIAVILLFFQERSSAESVKVDYQGGSVIYPLSEDRVFSVPGPLGYTTIEIKDGNARITDSPCPEKTCMSIRIGNTISCLPNKVLVTLTEKNNSREDVDASTF